MVLPVTIVGAILVFVVPIPPAVLDVLLSANLTLAVLVLLTTLAIRTPQEFSAFPTILLTTTLTRLVLNVATTRLVLTRGGEHGARRGRGRRSGRSASSSRATRWSSGRSCSRSWSSSSSS